MAQQKDLYKILGVSRDATQEEIKGAYKKLVRKYHPDFNPDDPVAEDRFKEVAVAFEALGNPEKRKLYDEFGLDGLRSGFDPEKARAYQQWSGNPFGGGFGGYESNGAAFDLGSLFEQFFGGRPQGFGGFGGGGFGGFGPEGMRADMPQRGADVEVMVTLDFLDALHGTTREIDGASFRNKPGTLTVKIPPGVEEGSKIRLSGQGAPGKNGGPPGNLYLVVHLKKHHVFKREGKNILLDLPITPVEAYRGAEIEVPTPHQSVNLRVPPQSQSGQKLRLRGKGVPDRKGQHYGDLIVTLKVVLPNGNSEKVTQILDELEPFYNKDVRAELRA